MGQAKNKNSHPEQRYRHRPAVTNFGASAANQFAANNQGVRVGMGGNGGP